jgi:nicotinamide mononucleotide transporter
MFIASILGITTVLQISNLKRANALNGMISSSLIIYSAIVNHVFADGLLQLVYIVALDIPLLFIWGKSKEETATTQIENLQGWLKYIGLMLGLFIGFYLVLSIPAIADKQPIIDSLGVAIGLTASMLLLQKNKHQYVFWALQGIISIILWARASMISGGSLFSPLAVMYVFYLLNDLVGYTVYSKKGKKAIHV